MSLIASAAISAGASLLGGLFGRKSEKKKQAAQNEYNKPINIRKRAEEGGFNPLLWAGQGNLSTPVQSTNYMGNAIANAGLAVSDAMSEKRQLDIEKSKLEMDRERLDHLIQQATIRPKTGGVYAQVQKTPSIKKTGAPLMSGAGVAGKVPLVLPHTYDHPENPEKFDAPTTVLRDDGLPGANPDAPAEMEADLWDAARDGTLINFGWEIYKRNTMSPWQRQNWENVKKEASNKVENASETFKDVFMRPRKKDAKLPKIDFPSYLPSISN